MQFGGITAIARSPSTFSARRIARAAPQPTLRPAAPAYRPAYRPPAAAPYRPPTATALAAAPAAAPPAAQPVAPPPLARFPMPGQARPATPAAAPAAPVAAAAAGWSCKVCTYQHEGSEAQFLSCAMCGTPQA